MLKNDPRFLPIALFVTNDVIVTLDMISNDVESEISWACHLGGAFAGLADFDDCSYA